MFQKIKKWLLHIVPFGWYCVSAGVNFKGGMILFQSLGFTAQMMAGCALLVVQFALPYFEYTERTTGENHSLGKIISWLVTMFCLFLTLSSMISTSVSNQILTGSELVSKELKIEADKLELDNVDVIDNDTYKENNAEIKDLFSKIESIKNTTALNFAGNTVYKNNKKQTLWEVTNGCTPNNVYSTNEKLYKNHCEHIRTLESDMTVLKDTNSKENHKAAIEKSVELKNSISKDTKGVGQQVALLFNTDILLDYIAEGVDFSNTSPAYILSNKPQIKERSMMIAIIISVVGMLIEVWLMKAFISHFIKKEKAANKKKLNISFKWLNLKWMKDIFIFKNKEVVPDETVKVEFDAVKTMSTLDLSKIKSLQNINKLESGRGIVPIDEITTLQTAVSHLYSAGEHIPLKSTIDTITEKLLNDTEYNKSLTGKTLSKEYITKICKTNRLKKFYFEIFENILIEKKDGKYYWMSEKDIELSFSRCNLS